MDNDFRQRVRTSEELIKSELIELVRLGQLRGIDVVVKCVYAPHTSRSGDGVKSVDKSFLLDLTVQIPVVL